MQPLSRNSSLPSPTSVRGRLPPRKEDGNGRQRSGGRGVGQPLHRGQGPRILIVGAGFAGVSVARELERWLCDDPDATITLLDQRNYLLFTPMLTEVAGGELDPVNVVTAIRRLSPRIDFIQGRVERIDAGQKRVTYVVGGQDTGIPEDRQTRDADHLVLALGSVTNYHGVRGLQEHSLPMKSLADAADARDRALALLERADAEPDPARRRALLTFVVGGGGYSGVETLAALNGLLRESAALYDHISPADVRTILVHSHDRILQELSPKLAAYARRELEARGVEFRLNTRLRGATADSVEVEGPGGGERIPAHFLIWTAGVTPSPIIATMDVPHGRHHGIQTDSCCRVPGFPGVWALGDCAEIPVPGPHKAGRPETYSPIAQNATREGVRVARNIVAELRGRQPLPFRYTPMGELALVGKRAGVARVFGVQVAGLPAWAMWRAVYLAKEPLLAKRAHTLAGWLLDMAFGRDPVEFPLGARASSPPAGPGSHPHAPASPTPAGPKAAAPASA